MKNKKKIAKVASGLEKSASFGWFFANFSKQKSTNDVHYLSPTFWTVLYETAFEKQSDVHQSVIKAKNKTWKQRYSVSFGDTSFTM